MSVIWTSLDERRMCRSRGRRYGGDDEPVQARLDRRGELALEARDAGGILLLRDELERRDVLPAHACEHGLARQPEALLEPTLLDVVETGLQELAGQLLRRFEPRPVDDGDRRKEGREVV